MRSGVKLLLLSVLTTGCFTDMPTGSSPSMIGHTDGDVCPQGMSGCACYGNGTCDDGLGCAEQENVCVPLGCEPGTLACLCDEGDCNGALVCVGSVCRQPTEDTTASASSTQGPTATATSGSDSDTTGDDSSSGTTEDDDDSDTEDASGDTTGPDLACDEVDCAECVECVVMPGAACEDLATACENEPGCLTAAECMASCGTEGICFDNCCEGATADAINAAESLNLCRSDHCTANCGEYHDALCV